MSVGKFIPRKNPMDRADIRKQLFSPKSKVKLPLPADYPSEEELFTDFSTYCNELLWIRSKKGRVIPFLLNPTQNYLLQTKAYHRAKGKNRFMVLKSRRQGVTTLEQAESFFLTGNHEHQYAVSLAHDNPSTHKIFDISLLFFKMLEPWARPVRKTENRKELNFHNLGSVFYINTAGGRSFGRGMTLQRVHGSEVAFWPKTVEMASTVAGLSEAASEGEMVFESTANGVGNWFHKTWTVAKEEMEGIEADPDLAGWVPIFLPWHIDVDNYVVTNQQFDDMNLSREEEDIIRAYPEIAPGHILWRRRKMRELYDVDRGDSIFRQEYPINDIEAFISSGKCFFDTEKIGNLVNTCKRPIQTADGNRMKIWREPVAYHTYVIGADIAEGVPGGNRTSITVMDIEKAEEVACWVGICSPERAAELIAELGNLYHNALAAPEANEFGHSTINSLLNQIGYAHIFQHDDYQRPTAAGAMELKYGWTTNAKTRPILLSAFRHALQGGLYQPNDKELMSECMAFVDSGHGKYEAAPGSFDDRIFAHAIAWQARERGALSGQIVHAVIDTGHQSPFLTGEERPIGELLEEL